MHFYSLRRRFEQNQEDCTYTVLALLPTVRDEIVGALPVEQISEQLQQERQERLKRLGASEAGSTEYPSAAPSTIGDDVRSLTSSGLQGSYLHTSQLGVSNADVSNGAPRPKRSKAQLWQDMKINSITRALTLVYTLCLLTLLTRIQLNLLGRRTYLSSVVALAAPPNPATASTIALENNDDDNYDNAYGNDFETNRKYLTFSWWLLHRGSRQIMERVMAAVKDVFGQVNIREDVSLESLAELIRKVRRRVEGGSDRADGDAPSTAPVQWLAFLLPPSADEIFVIRQSATSDSDEPFSPVGDASTTADDPLLSLHEADDQLINRSLRRLLDETADLIESPTFGLVLSRILDTAFGHLVDHRIGPEAFRLPPPPPAGTNPATLPRITELPADSAARCKLAHILPVFCKQAHAIALGSGELLDVTLAGVAAQEGGALGNDYLAAVDRVPDLAAFAALVYSSNWEYEPPEHSNPRTAPVSSAAAAAARTEGLVLVEDDDELEEAFQISSPPPASGAGLEAAWQKATALTSVGAPHRAPSTISQSEAAMERAFADAAATVAEQPSAATPMPATTTAMDEEATASAPAIEIVKPYQASSSVPIEPTKVDPAEDMQVHAALDADHVEQEVVVVGGEDISTLPETTDSEMVAEEPEPRVTSS